MTTDLWISIGLVVLTVAVVFNALVTGWMLWHYLTGIELAEGIIDRAQIIEDAGQAAQE